MGAAKKNATNPFFTSKYADLGEIIACIKEPFSANGLAFIQFPITSEDRAGVETILLHESGEWISNEFTLKCAKNDPQGYGSALTYSRRYGLQAACGIPSEDDDGNAASAPEKDTKKIESKATTPTTPHPATIPKTPAEKAEAWAAKRADQKWFEIVNPLATPAKWKGKPLSDLAADGDLKSLESIRSFFAKSGSSKTPALNGLLKKIDMAITEAKSNEVPTATDPATGATVDAPY